MTMMNEDAWLEEAYEDRNGGDVDTANDQWDWDIHDDSQYCEHGTFIGSWWGPDILCGYCEAGGW